MVKFLKDVRSN